MALELLEFRVGVIIICLDITPKRLRVIRLANLHDNFVIMVMTQFSMLGRVINFGT